jgi:hypothetical protein
MREKIPLHDDIISIIFNYTYYIGGLNTKQIKIFKIEAKKIYGYSLLKFLYSKQIDDILGSIVLSEITSRYIFKNTKEKVEPGTPLFNDIVKYNDKGCIPSSDIRFKKRYECFCRYIEQYRSNNDYFKFKYFKTKNGCFISTLRK